MHSVCGVRMLSQLFLFSIILIKVAPSQNHLKLLLLFVTDEVSSLRGHTDCLTM